MLAKILTRRPATSIDQVVEMMTAIDAVLPDHDGLKWFNRLYLEVTVAVRRALDGSGTGVSPTVGRAPAFHDPAFMAALDVVFANLYFDAAAAGDTAPAKAPPAWRPLFTARHTPGLARIQWALAGMNAHINRDLPYGIVATYRATGGTPRKSDPRHTDFEQVNGILEAVETQVKGQFAVGVAGRIDAIGGNLDDILAMWKVRAAREAAWTNAEVLWTLESAPMLRGAFAANLDSFTGFAGRGLLVRTA